MRLPYWLFVAVALGGCSQTTQSNMQASFTASASQIDPAVTATADQSDSAPAEPALAEAPVTPGWRGLVSFFAPARPVEVAQAPEVIPGDFVAPENPPLPPARPDFGDRPQTTQIAAAPEAAPAAAGATTAVSAPAPALTNTPPAQTVARAEGASLAAYEFRSAGVPMPEGGLRATNIAFAPAHLELATPGRLGANPGVGPVAQRWRAAYDDVETNCFPETLRRALDQLARHFDSEVLVTSGRRERGRRGSLHRACKAADVRIVGVSPGEVARVAKTIPGINGVGTYRRVAVTHIDVRAERFAWHR
jgi:hypothetical protein